VTVLSVLTSRRGDPARAPAAGQIRFGDLGVTPCAHRASPIRLGAYSAAATMKSPAAAFGNDRRSRPDSDRDVIVAFRKKLLKIRMSPLTVARSDRERGER
jgi:hypothetical protein